MSCSDKDSQDKENSDVSSVEGVIVKDAVEQASEMSSEIPDIGFEREDADGAPNTDDQGASSLENQLFRFGEGGLALDDDIEIIQYQQDQDFCSCKTCKDQRTATEKTLEEMHNLQVNWMTLRQYIRTIYKMVLEVKPPSREYQEFIKEHVQKLFECDPHQLYQRLETQVQEVAMETKVKQLELLKKEKDSPALPFSFISGLLNSYKKMMAAAKLLAPILEDFQNEHLSKFNLTWIVLNQHMYESCVYTEPFIQNHVREFIDQLSKSPDPGDTNKRLVREILSLEDEISLVSSLWQKAETRINQYTEERANSNEKPHITKEDLETYYLEQKRFHEKMWNQANSDLSTYSEIVEQAPSHKSCPCDECTVCQLFSSGGLITPPHSPSLPLTSDSENGDREEGEGRQQTDSSTECECHVCTAPPGTSPLVELDSPTAMNFNQHKGGFHLYPHIHGTGGVTGENVTNNVYPHLYNIHSSLNANNNQTESTDCKQPATGDTKSTPVLRPSTPPVPPPKRPDPLPPPTKTASSKPHRHSTTQTPAARLHQSLPDVVPPTCHGHMDGKRVPCNAQDRKPVCHAPHDHEHHHDHHETSPEDSCSDRSSSTQRGDSRHCDCCYCEVFGHGVPSVAPVSRNYTEMRERLRLLLTKKKAKCKPTSNVASPPAIAPSNPSSPVAGQGATVNGDVNKPKDPRDLEDLLDFIEGNPSQKCKDEKKAAKKARQKQKKQDEIERKKREEEEAERRKIEEEEAARALLKQQRKEAKKAKKKKKALALASKEEEEPEQVPQMVTIKRVMEPNSAEPTVTITLRGATPNEDKVLYTLLNGQVCRLPKDAKNGTRGGKQTQQQQSTHNGGKSKNQQNINTSVVTNNSTSVYGNPQKLNVKMKKETNSSNNNQQKVAVTQNLPKKKDEIISKPTVKPSPAPVPAPAPPAPPAPLSAAKLKSPTAIQINNAINRLSSRQSLPSNFSMDSLNLPPGITITKVDPSQVVPQRKPISQQQNKTSVPQSQPPPPPQAPAQSASNVIVVDTGKLKDFNSIANKDYSDDANGKKKKKKKNGSINNVNSIPTNEPPKSNMVRLTMNGGLPKRIMNPPQLPNDKVMPPQAAIIKLNGSMVTIRSPALQQAIDASQPESDQAKKKKKKKKCVNGQGNEDSWSIDGELPRAQPAPVVPPWLMYILGK